MINLAILRSGLGDIPPAPRTARFVDPVLGMRGLGDDACGAGAFQDPQSPWLTDGSGKPSTTPHCVLDTYSAKVYTQLGVSPDVAAALPPGFNPNVPAVPGAVSVASWWANPQSGGCPVVDISRNMCGYADPSNGQFIISGCNQIRECDALIAGEPPSANPFGTLTQPPHVEYGLPGGPSGNVTKLASGGAFPGSVAAGLTTLGTSQAGKTQIQQAQDLIHINATNAQPGVTYAGNPAAGNPLTANGANTNPAGGGGVVNNYYGTAPGSGSGAGALSSTVFGIPVWLLIASAAALLLLKK